MIYSLRKQCIDVIFMLMLILSAGGLLFVFNRNIASASFLLVMLFVLIFMENKWRKTIVNSIVFTFSILVILGSINYLYAITEQTANKYLFLLMVVALAVLFLFHFKNNRTNQQLIRSLYVALGLIVFHSLLNAIAYFFLKNNLTVIISEYHECETFLNIFFYTTDRGIINFFGVEFCRNQGLFWEPGVLQGFLNMFFFLEAFIIKKRKSLLLLTAIVILTTYSTTGLALLLIQFGVYLVNEFKTNKLLAALLVILMLPIYLIFNFNLEDKVQGGSTSSFQKRLFDLKQPISIAIDYPITGIGLDIFLFQKFRSEYQLSDSFGDIIDETIGIESTTETTKKGSSNSITFLFAAMGFPTAILLLYMFFKQQIIKEKKWLWMLIMVVSVMSEPLLLRPFFFLFIISGFFFIFYKITSHKQQIT